MSCDSIRELLFAYQFGEISADERLPVETHLLDCRTCLGDFLSLKRELETAESEEPASPASRQRLRRAVAQELGVGGELDLAQRLRAWWERPLAVGFAAAAVACALLAVHAVASSPGRMPRALAGDGAVDVKLS